MGLFKRLLGMFDAVFKEDDHPRKDNGQFTDKDREIEDLADAVTFLNVAKPVSSISGKEFQKDGVKLTEKVPAYYKEKYGGKIEHPELGEVKLDLEGVKDDISHGVGGLKCAAFMCVPEVIKRGIVFDRQKNWKNRGYDTYVLIAPVEINGKKYFEEVIVKRNNERQGLYLHEVEISERLENLFSKTPNEEGNSPTSNLIIGKKWKKFKGQNETIQNVTADKTERKDR